ncbi:response regulator [Alteromonadaceae bacterium BrNp21-10]|nr:response regulator [Alteromonadaceae bacterium BrNp21-10]
MKMNVLICDDSGFARRQMARCIPDQWEVEISFARHGQEALEMIRAGKADLMFLDLNMPILDGYQTMQIIKEQDLPTMVIVVSGDVQPEARKRILALGALDFISKPIDNIKLTEILNQYGIYSGAATSSQNQSLEIISEDDRLDAYREMANVAMGRAGEQLAKLLNEFIELPIPNVNIIESSELRMAVFEIQQNDFVSAVSQGFISAGINGEALVIFNETNFENLVKLLRYKQQKVNEQLEIEALMDVSNILISACLNALSKQLNVHFSQNHPIILGRHCDLSNLLERNISRWNKVLAIEIGYSIENQDINFDLLLLFPDKSSKTMFDRLISLNE